MGRSRLEQVLEKGLLSIQLEGRMVGFKRSLLRPGEENNLRHAPIRACKGNPPPKLLLITPHSWFLRKKKKIKKDDHILRAIKKESRTKKALSSAQGNAVVSCNYIDNTNGCRALKIRSTDCSCKVRVEALMILRVILAPKATTK